jgi:quercetin dioxygenase-like cupin family protein
MEPSPFEPIAVDLRDYVDFDLDAASGRRVVTTDVLAVDVVCLEPKQVIDARTLAGADAVYTVIGGRAWIVTDEAEVTLEALQAVVIPAGIPHGIRNDSPDPLILQVLVSPPDEMPGSVPGPAAAAAGQSLDAVDASGPAAAAAGQSLDAVDASGPAPATATTAQRAAPSKPPLLDRLRKTLGG